MAIRADTLRASNLELEERLAQDAQIRQNLERELRFIKEDAALKVVIFTILL